MSFTNVVASWLDKQGFHYDMPIITVSEGSGTDNESFFHSKRRGKFISGIQGYKINFPTFLPYKFHFESQVCKFQWKFWGKMFYCYFDLSFSIRDFGRTFSQLNFYVASKHTALFSPFPFITDNNTRCHWAEGAKKSPLQRILTSM